MEEARGGGQGSGGLVALPALVMEAAPGAQVRPVVVWALFPTAKHQAFSLAFSQMGVGARGRGQGGLPHLL